jgi:hypothetical protein
MHKDKALDILALKDTRLTGAAGCVRQMPGSSASKAAEYRRARRLERD